MFEFLSAHPSFTHTSALSIRRFYPSFTRCDIRTSAYPQIRLLPVPAVVHQVEDKLEKNGQLLGSKLKNGITLNKTQNQNKYVLIKQ